MKKMVFCIVCVLMIVSAAGSIPAEGASPKPSGQPEKRVVFDSLPPGGTTYTEIVAISQLINTKTELKSSVKPTTSAFAQMDFLRDGNADVAKMPLDALLPMIFREIGPLYPEESAKGRAPFTNVRLLMEGSAQWYAFVTGKGWGIKTISDLRGKRVASRYAPYMTNQFYGVAELRAYGLDPEKDIKMMKYPASTQAFDAMAAKEIDAAMGALGGEKLIEFDANVGTYVIPFDKDKMSSVLEVSRAAKFGMSTARPGVPIPTPSVGVPNVLIAREGLSDDIVYLLTKGFLENSKELVPVDISFLEWNKSNAIRQGFEFPYHPGAIKYYKEIGIWKEEQEARQKKLLASWPK